MLYIPSDKSWDLHVPIKLYFSVTWQQICPDAIRNTTWVPAWIELKFAWWNSSILTTKPELFLYNKNAAAAGSLLLLLLLSVFV